MSKEVVVASSKVVALPEYFWTDYEKLQETSVGTAGLWPHGSQSGPFYYGAAVMTTRPLRLFNHSIYFTTGH
jgi:hypothetical protein